VLGGAVFAVVALNRGPAERGPEPLALGPQTVEDSFGCGDGVRWSHCDAKQFDFELHAATRAIAVLHYQAKEIDTDDVIVSVNGVDVGPVPGDTLDADDRRLELVIPPRLFNGGEQNHLLFDAVKNPPLSKPWRVWNLRIETLALPVLPKDQLLTRARADSEQAKHLYDLRGVGSDNLFRAWKLYRDAWLTMEAMDEKPEEYEHVRQRLKVIAGELEHQCRMLIMEAQKQVELKNPAVARQTLEDVKRFFPTREHRCFDLAQLKLGEL
jgi:hypothetical protein